MLEVDRLTNRFGVTLAVDGLTFRTEPGRVLGFLGPNGAGKTTTLRTLLGLTIPTSGSATVEGRWYSELRDPTRVIGAVLEGPQFHPGRTGRNHLRVLASAAGLPAGRVDEVLHLVELDGAGRRRVKGLLAEHAAAAQPGRGAARGPARSRARRARQWPRPAGHPLAARLPARPRRGGPHGAELEPRAGRGRPDGRRGGGREPWRLIAQGTLDELTAGAGAAVWVRSPARDRLREALRAKDVTADDGQGDWLTVHAATLELVGDTAAEHGIAVHELYRQQQSLEDVFLQLTEGTEAGR